MEKNNVLTVPASIIVAALIIAGAIFVTSSKKNPIINAPNRNVTTKTIQAELVSATEDHILGKADAPVAIIEYSDPECPFCKVYHTTLHQILNQYGKSGDVAWIYRQFPLYKANSGGQALHSRAGKEAEATECAAEQGGNDTFWAYLDNIFEVTPSNNKLDPKMLPQIANKIGLDVNKFNSCLQTGKYADKIDKSYQKAAVAGGTGTPYVVMYSKAQLSDDDQTKILTDAINAFGNNSQGIPDSIISFDSNKHLLAWEGALPYEITKAVVADLVAINNIKK